MCKHPNMHQTARRDYCPDCKYEYYYGDAHATGDAAVSRLVNIGGDEPDDNGTIDGSNDDDE